VKSLLEKRGGWLGRVPNHRKGGEGDVVGVEGLDVSLHR
jgi:hypothetical protein